MTKPSVEFESTLSETNRLQTQAADPAASVWVSANAGTGKTHVLTNRVLRLLLAGTAPEKILCLTYTKAAAALMSTRIFDRLAGWVMLNDAALADELQKLTGKSATADGLAHARTLFAAAIETPGGFKVQTIHAFCERLLQRFPLEAGVVPNFKTLDEHETSELIAIVADRLLLTVASAPDHALKGALARAVTYINDQSFDDVLSEALKHRGWLVAYRRFAETTEQRQAAARLLFEAAFGLGADETEEALVLQMARVLAPDVVETARQVLAGGKTSDIKLSALLGGFASAGFDRERAALLEPFFLTVEKRARSSLMTKTLSEANTDLSDRLIAAQQTYVALHEKAGARDVVEATLALTAIAEAVMALYHAEKERRAALDFEDLIETTVRLLDNEGTSAWVLFKLDEGLSHILVDESQDTSPLQWQLVDRLSEEFFSGQGAHDVKRTVFAVGDEKQSIYSFQGAVPEKFAEQGDRFAERSKRAGLDWHLIPLTLSFRTVAPVLEAVDRVFADPAVTPGVRSTDGKKISHAAFRRGHAGHVELWDVETPDKADEPDVWSPVGDQPTPAPLARVADRIAETIASWIKNGEVLQSTGRSVRPGDILILVRKRTPFAPAIISALKAREVPVAGADRMDLVEQIAVKDLMSLGDFLTLPEDDLALAEVLKSPIFGLDDDDLFAIGYGRKGTLWKALRDKGPNQARWQAAADALWRWRRLADFSPPYEFFANLLDKDGVRKKLLARLGPDAADPIDEFVQLALSYDESSPPSLAGFLHWMRQSHRDIKRDMDHGSDEVRVMTVHGAKGLEAPIVFLPDTCQRPANSGRRRSLLTLAEVPAALADAPPFVWVIKDKSRQQFISELKSAVTDKELEESNRLLYVAMTRARDRLYVAGFGGAQKLSDRCWYRLIERGLETVLQEGRDCHGRRLRFLSAPQIAEQEAAKAGYDDADQPGERPDWAERRAPSESQLAIPIAPSRLRPYDVDHDGEPLATQPHASSRAQSAPTLSPLVLSDNNRFLRGDVTHALLQYLPAFDRDDWRTLAQRFVDARADALPRGARTSIVSETFAVLNDEDFAALFGPKSRAEVPIAALILNAAGKGPPVRLNGTIDRLADTGKEILVVDYKTNRPSPEAIENVPEAYLYQLASYRLALSQLYAGRVIRCSILWTDVPKMMPIPSDILETYEKLLWKLDGPLLDAAQSRS